MVTNGFTLVFGKVAAATGIQLFTESGKQSVWGMSMSWGLLLSHSGKEKSLAGVRTGLSVQEEFIVVL